MYKILIVDDSNFMRNVIKNILSKNGFSKFLEARNGIEAVELYESERPNLVILDIAMPEKDGFSTLIDILKIDKKATVIGCSSSSNSILLKELIEEGVKDFIVKPFTEKQFIYTVKKALKNKKKQD